MIVKILLCVFWMLIIPMAVGMLLTSKMKKEYHNVFMLLLNGYLTEIALFQIVYIVFVLKCPDFNKLYLTFQILIVIVAILSVVFGLKNGKDIFIRVKKTDDSLKKQDLKYKLLYIVPILLIAFQMVMRLLIRVYDGDDAFFVATAVVTEQSGKIGTIDPYTGFATAMDVRHAFAASPVLLSYFARATGIHATVIAHMVWADMVLMLVYSTIAMIGKTLLGEEQKKYVPFFLTLTALMNIFGYVSIYVPATFLLGRTWQGKSMFAAWIIPLMFLGLLMLAQNTPDARHRKSIAAEPEESESEKTVTNKDVATWIFITVIMAAGTAMTSSAIVFLPILLVMGVVLLAICKKKPMWLLYAALCCVINICIGIVFVLA